MVDKSTIDAKQVLMYLNQLGYTNISAHILKDFLTDLKKLIKSSAKQSEILDKNNKTSFMKENVHKHVSQKSCLAGSKLPKPPQSSARDQDLNEQDIPSKRLKHISVHILKNSNKMSHEHCVHVEESCESENKSTSKESKIEISDSTSKTTIPTKDSKSTFSTNNRQRGKPLKKTINRRDPVALYHYYQSEWKKVKFPGEEEHALLRKMVRKKLQGEQMLQKF